VSAHVRGHYRIDSHGRIEAILDVNSAALKLHKPQPLPPNQMQTLAARVAVYSLVAMLLCAGGLLVMPQVERAFLASQYAKLITVRHMHGHHMHDAADRYFRGE
jgi:hypothetical protein